MDTSLNKTLFFSEEAWSHLMYGLNEETKLREEKQQNFQLKSGLIVKEVFIQVWSLQVISESLHTGQILK